MNFWEKFAVGFLAVAESTLPLFIHSSKGVVILNASEGVVNGILGGIVTTSAAAPTPITTGTPLTVTATATTSAPIGGVGTGLEAA